MNWATKSQLAQVLRLVVRTMPRRSMGARTSMTTQGVMVSPGKVAKTSTVNPKSIIPRWG